MDIYTYNDYKTLARDLTNDLRQKYGQRYTFEKMANACGIQKTYLSRVLNGKGNLSADQLYSACEYLGLSPVEADFVDCMREFQTSTNSKRRERLKKKMDSIRSSRLKTEAAVKLSTVHDSEKTWEYYSDFNLHLTHLLLTISEYAQSSEKISNILKILPNELEKKIRKLENWGLVIRKGSKLEVKSFNQHLPENSAVFKTFAVSQRLKTIEKLNREKEENDYFFSALISADTGFQTKLRKQILSLLEEARKQTEKSEPEHVYQLNIDFFAWK